MGSSNKGLTSEAPSKGYRNRRRSNDYYPTPQELANAICRRLARTPEIGKLNCTLIIEPSAGSGNFIRAARSQWPSAGIIAVDVCEVGAQCRQAGADDFHCDDWPAWVKQRPFDRPALVVGNPPYSQAQQHVEAALDHLPWGSLVAFLLRQSFLCSAKRLPLWARSNCVATIPIVGRPSYTDDGRTDASEYEVFVWRVGYEGPRIGLPHLVWKGSSGV